MVRDFLALPLRLHREDRQWVAPLTSDNRRFMDPRHNPYFAEAEIDHFLARDHAGRTVGRISTTVDPRYVERFGRHGYFGWFECVDDPEVARALLETAERWAGERGMERLTGPHSYCATQEFGLLDAGHDRRPAAFQPHNPPYYRELLEKAGYTREFRVDTFSYRADRDEEQLRRLVRRGERMVAAHDLTVRDLDPTRWESEMDLLHELVTVSFARDRAMVPMSREVLGFQTDQLRPFLDPRLTRIVELDQRPVGFSMLMADANELLATINGRPTPGFLLRYPWLKRRIGAAIVLMIGVRPEVAGLGVGRVLAGEIGRVGLGEVPPYRAVHTTWVHEKNWQSRAYMNLTGAAPARTYGIYGKELS
ncbi:hypothetical protein [Streptomyces triticirhizae]|uniref:N-acetyltransferase n=1 Tax=Streptomyces triticirhizae TaxID=2483353 RepID=A0A3M2M7H4_9ACTN|nr:hypothetical protein [Streptomyces triticirhizae]RMI44803.1 hypothetical protein EBN88_04740 [Streptomyces triticirhizae]